MRQDSVVAVVVGLVASAVGCAVAIKVLRRLGVVDVPNLRSSHRQATVRGAGAGVAFGSVAGLIAATAWANGNWSWRAPSVLVIASLSVGLLGLIDDLRSGISFRIRLAAQVIVTAAAVVGLSGGGADMPWRVLLLGVSVFFVVGYVNAFNFMDGINGISAVTALGSGAMFALVGRLEGQPFLEAGGASVAAASLAFVPFNFPSARAFLGDAGSYFLGIWIALLGFTAAHAGVPLDVVAAPLALYLADVGWTLVSRVRRGEHWHEAHRDHAYQRLSSAGLSHTGTTLLVLAITLLLAGLGLIALRAPAWRPVVWPSMVGLVLAYLVAPFLLRHRDDGTGQAAQPSGKAGRTAQPSGGAPGRTGAP